MLNSKKADEAQNTVAQFEPINSMFGQAADARTHAARLKDRFVGCRGKRKPDLTHLLDDEIHY